MLLTTLEKNFTDHIYRTLSWPMAVSGVAPPHCIF